MIRVFFATNRNLERSGERPDFGNEFNRAGPSFFRTGEARVRAASGEYTLASVHLHPERRARQDERVEAVLGDPDRHPAWRRRTARAWLARHPPAQDRPGSERLFRDMREAMAAEGRHALVYIHGYANSFEDSLLTAAELADTWRIDGMRPLVFVFSWPSDNSLFPWAAYYSDRADARLSGDAMARALAKFVDFLRGAGDHCGQPLHLVAHSMGAYALYGMLEPLYRIVQRRRLPTLFEHALLCAADVDADALGDRDKLGRLVDLARSIAVYYSRGDAVLAISDLTKDNPERLGSIGPRRMDALSDHVTAIDCRQVDDTGLLDAHHEYYLHSPPVVADIRQVLAGVAPDEIDGRVPLHSPRRYRIPGAR